MVTKGIFNYYRLTKQIGIKDIEAKELLYQNYGCAERLIVGEPIYLILAIESLFQEGMDLSKKNIEKQIKKSKLEDEIKSQEFNLF